MRARQSVRWLPGFSDAPLSLDADLGYLVAHDPTGFHHPPGRDLVVTDRVRAAVAGTRVIAADSGMRHARALGVEPELWVGDFDSAQPALIAEWPDVERQPYPSRKAATDGEIAVSEALARGARRVVLLGALGGERSDHALQHLAQALQLKEERIDVLLSSGEEEAVPLLPGQTDLVLPVGALFSIVGFTALTGLCIEGARFRSTVSRCLSARREPSPTWRSARCASPSKRDAASCSPVPHDMTGA